jgi:di/tricarboxylate transporter
MELAVRPHGQLVGRSAREIRLRNRYGINLLAVSRKGRRSVVRLKALAIEEGDVLLMQGSPESIREFASHYGCVPLAERPLRVPDASKALTASAIMAAAIGGAAFGLVPAAIAFASAVLAAVLLRVVPVRQMYDAIDWSIIVLLGGLIPVAGAMASTGAADLLAKSLLGNVAQGNIVIALAVVLVITMTLSDFMNNAATAAVMCPIAIGIATQLDSNPEPFLMAVAVAASCAFLTPIGHQNNTLILGPGGFKFGDYWKLGLPLEIVVITVSIPLILWVWPP